MSITGALKWYGVEARTTFWEMGSSTTQTYHACALHAVGAAIPASMIRSIIQRSTGLSEYVRQE